MRANQIARITSDFKMGVINKIFMFFDFDVLAKTRKNHNFKIRPKKTRPNYFKFSFFNRYITDWNGIPTN